MYPWYRDSVAAAAAAGLGGPVGVVGSGFCSTGPGQGGATIKTEGGYSDCMLALDYVQSKVSFNRDLLLTIPRLRSVLSILFTSSRSLDAKYSSFTLRPRVCRSDGRSRAIGNGLRMFVAKL